MEISINSLPYKNEGGVNTRIDLAAISLSPRNSGLNLRGFLLHYFHSSNLILTKDHGIILSHFCCT